MLAREMVLGNTGDGETCAEAETTVSHACMQVFIQRMSSSESFVLDISARSTVDEVKHLIQEHEGLPPARQTLLAGKAVLKDSQVLADCVHKEGFTLTLIVNPNKIKLTPLRPQYFPESRSKWFTCGFPEMRQSSGKFYYEVVLGEGWTHPQVGWVTDSFQAGVFTNTGVGDDSDGWGCDGQRCKKWHAGSTPCDWPRWNIGDTVGCALDIDAARMEFSVNGQWVPEATFVVNDVSSFYPALSMCGDFTIIIGQDSWRHAPPHDDYQALAMDLAEDAITRAG